MHRRYRNLDANFTGEAEQSGALPAKKLIEMVASYLLKKAKASGGVIVDVLPITIRDNVALFGNLLLSAFKTAKRRLWIYNFDKKNEGRMQSV
ncbi:MAG: hypothetical protein ACL7BU_10970 [Candidatus Phlomobacter fragariae]